MTSTGSFFSGPRSAIRFVEIRNVWGYVYGYRIPKRNAVSPKVRFDHIPTAHPLTDLEGRSARPQGKGVVPKTRTQHPA